MKYLLPTLGLLLGILSCSEEKYVEHHYTSLEDALQDPTNVYSLRISNFSNLDDIDKLVNLEELTIYGRSDWYPLKDTSSTPPSKADLLKGTLSDKVSTLSKLKKLWIADDNLYALPESIGNLKLLKEIYISSGRFQVIPNSIGDLENLESFSLNARPQNIVLKLPESFSQLQNLQRLIIHTALRQRFSRQTQLY